MHYRYRERGAATLVTAVILLIAMSVITLAGARIAMNKQRISANSTHAERAFYNAEEGIENAIAYVKYNHADIASTEPDGWLHASSSPRWLNCASSDTSLPCGDGENNLYGADWLYYGPIPNLATPEGDYEHQVWALSDSVDDDAPTRPFMGCLNLGLTALLPSVTGALVNTVNGLLNTLGGLLGQPGLGLPSDLCLPLNFSSSGNNLPASKINPSLRLISESTNPNDALAGTAVAQQALSTASLFAWQPMAPLMVNGTVDLTGDVRVFGNARPPTVAPYDWSILQLNDVLGLNITNMLGLKVQNDVASLAPLLNLTVAEVLALDWNVTMPLSIWAESNTTLHKQTKKGLLDIGLSNARTCAPEYDGSADPVCLPLSQSITIPANSIFLLVPPTSVSLRLYLADVQDEHNLVSMIGGLLDSGSPVDFPDDLMEHVFGIPSADYAELQADATEIPNCNSLDSSSTGLYWVKGNCTLKGKIGSADSPPIVITNGNIDFADGMHFSGLLYMRGPSGTKINAPDLPAVRPTVLGAIVSESKIISNGDYNLVYDHQSLRASGYRAGEITRLPGGWTDQLTGP